jgi:hypothetical protein
VTDTVAAALIAAAASALGSILAFVVSIRRSLKTSNGAPLAKLLEARLGRGVVGSNPTSGSTNCGLDNFRLPSQASSREG